MLLSKEDSEQVDKIAKRWIGRHGEMSKEDLDQVLFDLGYCMGLLIRLKDKEMGAGDPETAEAR